MLIEKSIYQYDLTSLTYVDQVKWQRLLKATINRLKEGHWHDYDSNKRSLKSMINIGQIIQTESQ